MAQRDKIRQRVQQFLDPGQKIEHVFVGQIGGNPNIPSPTVAFRSKYRIFAVTERGMYVFSATPTGQHKPRKLLEVLPPSRISVTKGYWGKASIGSDEVWVHTRWHKDVKAADLFMSTIDDKEVELTLSDEQASQPDRAEPPTEVEETEPEPEAEPIELPTETEGPDRQAEIDLATPVKNREYQTDAIDRWTTGGA